MEVQFRFFKGSTTPAKNVFTLTRSPLHLTLHALKKKLIASQILGEGGTGYNTKDANVRHLDYVRKDEKRFAASTTEHWKVVSRLILDPNSSFSY